MTDFRFHTSRVLFILAPLAALVACQRVQPQRPTEVPAETTAQKRDDDFQLKERCAVAAERLDKLFLPTSGRGSDVSVSEVFYSPVRNSCVCQVTTANARAATTLLDLYDCLTREDLGSTLVDLNKPYQALLDAWQAKKDALKVPTRATSTSLSYEEYLASRQRQTTPATTPSQPSPPKP